MPYGLLEMELMRSIRGFNKTKHESALRNYKYPKTINHRPMDYLDEDPDILIKYLDEKKKAAREKDRSK
jgi:hypothetical protein